MNNDAIITELRALKTRVEALEANAGLKSVARIEAPAAPVPEEGVRIYYPPDPNSFMMPNNDELKKLRAIAQGEYPKLRPDFSNYLDADKAEHEFLKNFTELSCTSGISAGSTSLTKRFFVLVARRSARLAPAAQYLRRHSRFRILHSGFGTQ